MWVLVDPHLLEQGQFLKLSYEKWSTCWASSCSLSGFLCFTPQLLRALDIVFITEITLLLLASHGSAGWEDWGSDKLSCLNADQQKSWRGKGGFLRDDFPAHSAGMHSLKQELFGFQHSWPCRVLGSAPDRSAAVCRMGGEIGQGVAAAGAGTSACFALAPAGPSEVVSAFFREMRLLQGSLCALLSVHSPGLGLVVCFHTACTLQLLQLWAIAAGPGSQGRAILHSWNQQRSFKKLGSELWGQLWGVVCPACENNSIVKKQLWHFQLYQAVCVVKIILKDRG